MKKKPLIGSPSASKLKQINSNNKKSVRFSEETPILIICESQNDKLP